MSTGPPCPAQLQPRGIQLRLPRPHWILLAAAVLGGAYAGGHWHFFRAGPTYEIGGVNYALDIERAVVRARRQDRLLLLYFTGVNCVNARKMQRDVLRAPTVVRRLDQFACAALFTDRVPFLDEKAGQKQGDDNCKLQERLLGEVALPAFAVVDPEFDPDRPSDR